MKTQYLLIKMLKIKCCKIINVKFKTNYKINYSKDKL